MDRDTIQQLINHARLGDRAAFAELTNEHRSRVEAVLRAQWKAPLGENELDDLLQETFLRAFQSLERFSWQGADSLFRWLSSVALNVAREAARREGRTQPLDSDVDPSADAVTQSKALRREERFARLQKALDTLAPDYREVLHLVRLEGLPVKEVARRMNRTPNAVSRLLLRASRKLRETFGETESFGLPDRQLEPWEDDAP